MPESERDNTVIIRIGRCLFSPADTVRGKNEGGFSMRTKRFLAFLLVLLMVVSLFSAAALAEDAEDEPLVEDVPPC